MTTKKTTLGEVNNKTASELSNDQLLLQLNSNLTSKMGINWNLHSPLFLKRITLSRILYYAKLYEKIIGTPGVICEFGVQWGTTLSLLTNLRGIYEPYNYSRKIIGFDTFSGLSSLDDKDGNMVEKGDYSTYLGYEEELSKILSLHELSSPIPHIKKHEIVKGDVVVTLPQWLKENPYAVVSMAIFDMDIYKPTKVALEAILPFLTKGSLIVFDEINCPDFAGETMALKEFIGLNNLRLQRDSNQPYCAWAVFE